MTEPAGAHLDLDTLADLDEGLLTSGEIAAHRDHLNRCQPCREEHARLRSTRALLATLPAEPIPPVVADRLDAALAGAASTVVPIDSRRKRGWRAHPTAAGLGAAAAVVALLAAVVLGTTVGKKSHPSTSGDATASGPLPQTALGPLPVTTSGTAYTAANLAHTVPPLVRAKGEAAAAGASSPSQPSTRSGLAPTKSQIPVELARLAGSPAALRDCVVGIEEGAPPSPPLAIDFATFAGAPALLVVLPELDQAGRPTGRLGAWFVGAGCTSTDVHLLDYRAVAASG